MAHPMTLPMAVALAVAGGVLGIHLGRGAIAEINPVYFGPEEGTRFYADLVPGGYSPSASSPAYGQDFWANDQSASGQSGCERCGSFVEPAPFVPEADYPSMEIGSYIQTAAMPEPAPGDDRILMPEEVQRYAYFPITREEEQRNRTDRPAESPRLSYAGRPGSAGQGGEPEPIGM